MSNQSARILNTALATWLFISAFLWTHTPEQFRNAIMVSLIAATSGVISMSMNTSARYLNTVMGAWLFFSVWLLPRLTAATLWNNLIVGAVMFFVSLAGAVSSHGGARRMT